MSTDNRNLDLLSDVTTRLKGDFSVTNRLPDGANNIHPGPLAGDRERDVALVVRLIGGSSTRRGSRTQAGRLIQVKLEVSSTYFETKPTRWPYELFDAIEDLLEGLGGGGRGPDGRGGSISPTFDPQQNRYVADATYRYQTIH